MKFAADRVWLREACGKMSRKQTKRRRLNRPVILHLNLSDDGE
jgi:hypothetical protein